jgi:hypothetical protein
VSSGFLLLAAKFFSSTRVKILFSGSASHPSWKILREKKRRHYRSGSVFLFFKIYVFCSTHSIRLGADSSAVNTLRTLCSTKNSNLEKHPRRA